MLESLHSMESDPSPSCQQMPSGVSIVRLPESDWNVAASIYSIAFLDDPFTTECLRLDERRMPGFFEPLMTMAKGSPGADCFAVYWDGIPVSAATLLPYGWKADPRIATPALAELRKRVGFTASWRVARMLQSSSHLPKPPGCPAHLLFMGTLPEYRGRGCASLLLTRLDERSREIGADSIYLEVVARSPAMRLYQKHGYCEIGRARVISEEIAVLVHSFEESNLSHNNNEETF